MSNLKHWQDKIKEKRSKTSFRNFVKEMGSFIPIVLYKGEGEVSRYPKSDRIKVIPTKKYESIRDDLPKSGLDYNFNIDFFENYKKLINITGGAATMKDPKAENSEYAEAVWYSKNVYLSVIVIGNCENILYTFYAQDNVKNTLNSVMVWDNSDIVFNSISVIKGFKIFYSRYIVNSNNIWFSSNLIGCSECIFCNGLENQSYCINNKKYEKDEYFKKKEEILREKTNFFDYYLKVNKKAINLNSKNIINGGFCVYCEDVENAYYCYRLKNARNAFFVGHENGRTNVLDTICSDEASPGDIYGCANLGESENCYMSDAFVGQSLYYCFDCINSSFCLGCRGLKNKSYCILNKQYTKEEWEILADKIFAQMDKGGILGERIPPKFSPFYFNDTLAGLIGDFTKEEVEKEGYMWRDEEIKVDIPEGSSIIQSSDLGDYQGYDKDGNWKINPEVLKKVIKDSSGNYYRIVQMEYDFLVKHGLPLPEIHWMDRMKLNFGV